MTIEVTCARASEMGLVDPDDTLMVSQKGSLQDFQNVFYAAADKAVQSNTEVFVRVNPNTKEKR